jgi:hypothetical protein
MLNACGLHFMVKSAQRLEISIQDAFQDKTSHTYITPKSKQINKKFGKFGIDILAWAYIFINIVV